jgi:acyl-CoA thioester hydrolase
VSNRDDSLVTYPFVKTLDVRFRDLDGMGHVNHAVYLTYFEAARLGYYAALTGRVEIGQINMILVEVTASYHAPATFGERLDVGVRVSRIGTKSFEMEYLIVRPTDGRRIASGCSIQVMFDYAAGQSVAVSDEFRALVLAAQGE